MPFLDRVLNLLHSLNNAGDHKTGGLPPQTVLQQRYLIIRAVGKGGMGAVYLALDLQELSLNKQVALKEMSQSKLEEDELTEAIAQFRQEASILSNLAHQNLPRVRNFFEEAGRSYLVMDFIDGETLYQLINRMPAQAIPPEQAVYYALQLCDVLAYLHQQNPPIVFRDLKPANLMLDRQAKVFLIDFGIARFFKADKTHDTRILMTPGYAAPEQIINAQTTASSDIYSLGVTLHRALTGHDPLDNVPTLYNFPSIRTLAPQVPLELERLVHRMLAINPQDRPSSVLAVKRELLSIQGRLPSPPRNAQANGQQGPVVLGHPWGGIPDARGNDDPTINPGIGLPNTPIPPAPGPDLKLVVLTALKGILQTLKSLPPIPWQSFKASGKLRSFSYSLQSILRTLREAFTVGFFPIWTRFFTILFTASLVLALMLSGLTLSTSHGSIPLALFALLLFFFIVSVIAATSAGIQKTVPKVLLLFPAGLALLMSFLLQTDTTVQETTTGILHGLTIGTCMAIVLVALAIIALTKAILKWQTLFQWTPKATGLGIIALCIILQSAGGENERVPFLNTDLYPLRDIVFSSITAHQLLLIGLYSILGIALLRLSLDEQGFDRFLLFLITCVLGWLQFSFGERELHVLFPYADIQFVITLSQLLAFTLPCLGIALLYQPRYHQAWIYPSLILCIVLLSVFLQNYMTGQFTIPLLSQSGEQQGPTQLLTITLAQFLLAIFSISSFSLLARLRTLPGWIDRLLIFGIACSVAYLQFAFGEAEGQYTQLSSFDISKSFLSLSELVGFNRVLAIALIISALVVIFRGAQTQFHRRDRVVLIAIPLIVALLQGLFGNNEPLPLMSTDTQGNTLPMNLMLAGIPGLFSFIALLRIKKPLNWWDRFTLIFCTIQCIFLLTSTLEVQQSPLLSFTLQQGSTTIFQTVAPEKRLALMTLLITGISVFWLLRRRSPDDRTLLLRFLGIVLLCSILAMIWSSLEILLLFALILQIQVTLLVTQMERVR